MIMVQNLPRERQAWNLRTRRPWKRSDVTDKMVVAAYAEYGRDHARIYGEELPSMLDFARKYEPCPYPYDRLMSVLGCPTKVAYVAMERACDRGYIEFGVSLRTGWITDKGRSLFFPEPQGNA